MDDNGLRRQLVAGPRIPSERLRSLPNFTPNQMPLVQAARTITQGMGNDPKFHIKGSMAALLHGGNVTPGDLDLVAGSFPQINNALTPMGYPRVTPFNPRILNPPNALPPIDVLHSGDWGADNVPKTTVSGVRVTSVEQTIRDLKRDPRQDKRARNTRLISEIIRANTHESPF